jgi:hypothetical protein
VIETKNYAYNYVVIFREYCPKIQNLPNNLLMGDEAHFHLHGTVNKQTFCVTFQLQNLTNFTIVPFKTQMLHFDVLFGPEESMNPTSLSMKTIKPSLSNPNLVQR